MSLGIRVDYEFISDFFIRLDQDCGPLTLHSSLKDLVNYTRKGLDNIEHERLSGPSSVY